jgi:glycosyltransferase involved in cell wall biosynthesis
VKDFSVVICTYNGAVRVPEVLDRLKAQEGTDAITWEVLVVDNNSDDATAKVVRGYMTDWAEEYPLRYLFEPRQGKTYAIRRAFHEARGRLLGFLDDDNLPALDWVAACYEFGRMHPDAGAYGSRIFPMYEQEPPPESRGIEGAFAIVRAEETFQYPAGGRMGRMFAPGAGLVVRKRAWEESMPDELRLAGPCGSSSMGLHEDMEMQWYLHEDGWEIWHNPSMCIHHKLPRSRFEEKYLMRFFKELALSRHQYRMLTYAPWQRPIMTVVYMVSDLLKLVEQLYNYQRTSKQDISAKCRIQMRKFLLISPFYHWVTGSTQSTG